MSNETDAQHTIDLLSETEVNERMTSFKAALARMNANPSEAARIQALAEETDPEISEILAGDSPFEYDPEASLRARIMTVSAPPSPPQARTEEPLHETQSRTHQYLLEAERTFYKAEMELEMAHRRAALIMEEADRRASIQEREATLSAQQIELDALRDNLDSGHDRKERGAPRSTPRRDWLSWIGLNPAFTIALTAVIGSFAAMRYHASLIAITFAAAATFNVITYAIAIVLAAMRLTRSGPDGAESALRLLLAPRIREEAAQALQRKPRKRSKRNSRAPSADTARSPHVGSLESPIRMLDP
jgi:hypothetical protein